MSKNIILSEEEIFVFSKKSKYFKKKKVFLEELKQNNFREQKKLFEKLHSKFCEFKSEGKNVSLFYNNEESLFFLFF